MPKHDVMVARFPYGGTEDSDVTDWLIRTRLAMERDPRVGRVVPFKKNTTPITMARNLAVRTAREAGVDYLLMIDSDMSPDLPYPGAKRFWDSSFDFAVNHPGPCVVAAPYCGPPPFENCYVFKWANRQSEHPNKDFQVEQFTREEAAVRGGFEQVSALPTGLILIDLRVFDRLKPPFFYYEYTDEQETALASTEDVTFTRDVTLAGLPIYCNWDAWAGHWKRKRVGKPELLHVDSVRKQFRDAVLRNHQSDERLVMVGEGEPETGLPRLLEA